MCVMLVHINWLTTGQSWSVRPEMLTLIVKDSNLVNASRLSALHQYIEAKPSRADAKAEVNVSLDF